MNECIVTVVPILHLKVDPTMLYNTGLTVIGILIFAKIYI